MNRHFNMTPHARQHIDQFIDRKQIDLALVYLADPELRDAEAFGRPALGDSFGLDIGFDGCSPRFLYIPLAVTQRTRRF